LTGEFPTKPPVIQIVCKTQFQHPQVDQRGMVLPSCHPKFLNWTARDNLGKMIFEIAQILTMPVNNQPIPNNNFPQPQPYGTNPPNSNNPPSYGSNPKPYGSNNPPNSNNTPNSNKTEFEPLPVPKVPTNFPDLQDKSVEELQFLLSDEEGFSLFVEDQEFIKNLKTLREGILDQNEESASLNFFYFFL
jgi:hypothetical protein